MKEIVCTNGAFVVVYRLHPTSHKLQVLLGQRKSNETFELFGGQVDFELDGQKDGGPFAWCALRECGEESGLNFKPKALTRIALLQQRVSYQDVYLIGSVMLFAVYFPYDHSHESEEVLQVLWKDVDAVLLKDASISLASARMIAYFYKYHEARVRGENPHLIEANLGDKVVMRNGSETYTV